MASGERSNLYSSLKRGLAVASPGEGLRLAAATHELDAILGETAGLSQAGAPKPRTTANAERQTFSVLRNVINWPRRGAPC